MKKKLIICIGEIQQGDHGLWGRINGLTVNLKEIKDKDGKQKWLVNQTLNVFEIEEKPEQQTSRY